MGEYRPLIDNVWIDQGEHPCIADFRNCEVRYIAVSGGLQYVPFPPEPMTRDELMAWAQVIYKMR